MSRQPVAALLFAAMRGLHLLEPCRVTMGKNRGGERSIISDFILEWQERANTGGRPGPVVVQAGEGV